MDLQARASVGNDFRRLSVKVGAVIELTDRGSGFDVPRTGALHLINRQLPQPAMAKHLPDGVLERPVPPMARLGDLDRHRDHAERT